MLKLEDRIKGAHFMGEEMLKEVSEVIARYAKSDPAGVDEGMINAATWLIAFSSLLIDEVNSGVLPGSGGEIN